jgi:hypothetical protein
VSHQFKHQWHNTSLNKSSSSEVLKIQTQPIKLDLDAHNILPLFLIKNAMRSKINKPGIRESWILGASHAPPKCMKGLGSRLILLHFAIQIWL